MSSSSSTASACLFEPIAVSQPPELETDDPTLATVVLPAPPPLNSQRRDRDYKRPQNIFSYLPASDPGTTYSGLMGGLGLTLIPPEDDLHEGGRLRKRQRTDRSFASRSIHPSILPPSSQPQSHPTASTSTLNSKSTSTSLFTKLPSELPLGPAAAAIQASQRMNSASALLDHSNTPPVPPNDTIPKPSKSRDKGKEKEKPSLNLIKDEPQPSSLDVVDGSNSHINGSNHYNEDHCSSCRDIGNLLYCDGCPKSFHLWCLDPPMDSRDVPEGDTRWFCPACLIRQNPPSKPRRSLLAPLLQQLQLSIPTEFELPEDIRTFFKDVTTGPKGSYQDTTDIKVVRASSRFNLLDERDPFRLKDRNGYPVLCFRCGRTALPDSESGPSTIVQDNNIAVSNIRELRSRKYSSFPHPNTTTLWKSIASCDYCPLHWHLDCLDPPLASMPAAHKKWMCPAHVQHVAPKRRIPKHLPPVTDIVSMNCINNGNIEIIPADSRTDISKKMNIDEVHINGRRYRIPERVVVLDFWDKLRRLNRPSKAPAGIFSGVSSPLTSLSSLEDDSPPSEVSQTREATKGLLPGTNTMADIELLDAANLLLACRTPIHRKSNDSMEIDSPTNVLPLPARVDAAVQTEPPEIDIQLEVAPASVSVPAAKKVTRNALKPSENHTAPSLPLQSHRKGQTTRRAVSKTQKSSSNMSRITRSKTAPLIPPTQHTSETSSRQNNNAPHMVEISPAEVAETPSSKDEINQNSNISSSGTRKITRSMVAAGSISERGREQEQESAGQVNAVSSSSVNVIKTPSSQQIAKPPSVIPPPISTKSPFKIRIPKAINTAVAAATAAAAAAASSSSSSSSNARRIDSVTPKTFPKPSSDSDSSLSPVSSDSLEQNKETLRSKVNGIDTEGASTTSSIF